MGRWRKVPAATVLESTRATSPWTLASRLSRLRRHRLGKLDVGLGLGAQPACERPRGGAEEETKHGVSRCRGLHRVLRPGVRGATVERLEAGDRYSESASVMTVTNQLSCARDASRMIGFIGFLRGRRRHPGRKRATELRP
jgi:hypothetical protein